MSGALRARTRTHVPYSPGLAGASTVTSPFGTSYADLAVWLWLSKFARLRRRHLRSRRRYGRAPTDVFGTLTGVCEFDSAKPAAPLDPRRRPPRFPRDKAIGRPFASFVAV